MRSGAVDHPAARNLIGLLPQILFIDASDAPRAERMQSVFRLMAAEAREFQPGGEAVITRLADILVIEALRAWIETAPAAQAGWLGALHDRQIGHALALIQREPARRGCHVAQLADRLGYRSEAAFARAFKRVIGVSPAPSSGRPPPRSR